MIEKNNYNNIYRDYLSKVKSNNIKGFLALCVFICHLYGYSKDYIEYPRIIMGTFGIILQSLGYLSVAGFFFFSGYGLQYQLLKGGRDYIKKFPRNRLATFYVSFAVLTVLYILFYKLVYNSFSFIDLLKSLLFLKVTIANGWFLTVIFVFYLVFFLFHLLIKNNKTADYIIYLSVTILCIGFWFFVDPIWMQSSFAFILGLFWQNYNSVIDQWIFKRRLLLTVLSFALFSVLFLLGNGDLLPRGLAIIPKTISSLVFVLLIILISTYIDFSIFSPFGKIYFEIYVIQGFFLNLWRLKIIENVVIVILGTFAVSYIFGYFNRFINRIIRRD